MTWDNFPHVTTYWLPWIHHQQVPWRRNFFIYRTWWPAYISPLLILSTLCKYCNLHWRGDDGGCVTTSVQRGLCIYFFQRIMHTLHKGVCANFSQVVTRICGRDLSPPSEYPIFPIRSRRTFGSWDCVFVCTFENIRIKSMCWLEYTQAHHLLTEQAFHMIEIFSYTRIFPLLYPATYQPVFFTTSLNPYGVGGIWVAGDASLNRGRSPPYLQLLLSSRLERRENRVALAAIRESTHPILSKPFWWGEEKISRIILTAALDPSRDLLLSKIFSTSDAAAIFTFYCVFLLAAASFLLNPDSPRRKSLSALHNAFKNVSISSICSHSVAFPFLLFLFCGIVWVVGGHFGCWATFFALLRRRERKPCRPPFFVGKMAGTGGLFSPVSRVFAGFYNSFFASYSPPLCHLVLLLIGWRNVVPRWSRTLLSACYL